MILLYLKCEITPQDNGCVMILFYFKCKITLQDSGSRVMILLYLKCEITLQDSGSRVMILLYMKCVITLQDSGSSVMIFVCLKCLITLLEFPVVTHVRVLNSVPLHALQQIQEQLLGLSLHVNGCFHGDQTNVTILHAHKELLC